MGGGINVVHNSSRYNTLYLHRKKEQVQGTVRRKEEEGRRSRRAFIKND